ncbi:hypothetical protein CRG98_028912 [Punica granatum]|uniref:Uncharacterized protein n=1 Tax=Punica granatum TaxID=22663 RepID=A0A2I0J4C8_PUNGR|nr:hypothetical protein CRG98_028912 [Punica granatum]
MGCRACGTLNSGSSVIATLERLDCDWGPHSCTFPDCRLACAAVLGKARGAESQEDRRVEHIRQNQYGVFGTVLVPLERFVHARNPFVNAYKCKREFKEECVLPRWLGHAPFVGVVACDFSWREGRSSVFGVQRGSREVFPVSIVVVWDSDCFLVSYFLQWEKGNDEGANYVRNFNARAQGIELDW